MNYGFDESKNKVEVVAMGDVETISSDFTTVAANESVTWNFSKDVGKYTILDFRVCTASNELGSGTLHFEDYDAQVLVHAPTQRIRVTAKNTGSASAQMKCFVVLLRTNHD